MSDTPRTDADEWMTRTEVDDPTTGWTVRDEAVVDADLARELERELAAAKAQLVSNADELSAMRKQRDKARRIVCIRIALDETKHYMGTHGYPCSNGPSAMEIAAECGWDCFAEKEGGGA